MRCVLFDFEDSFTYNIVSELQAVGGKVHVVSPDQAKAYLQKLKSDAKDLDLNNTTALVYGPGPGHPDQYAFLYPHIEALFGLPQFVHFGICLGHQIFWRIMGYPVERSRMPLHGQQVPFSIPRWRKVFLPQEMGRQVMVQRYNSLAVKVSGGNYPRSMVVNEEEECIASLFKWGVSYQFHPESVGTTHVKIFFKGMKRYFLHYERKKSDRITL
ncbi:MAG: aminodeoxychorismate/anthranilate synthase component II [Oligoflexia bacterium]|nr:aminodeoxychorismate/anthranilate synthase component II [Oligoflexia bacterium]MBF0366819.1 aminodeoxychorismate/anthranilate synthase component II [Oligoflexia bacterium]